MSYHDAVRSFVEVKTLLGAPPKDPILWNLSNGLQALAIAMKADLDQIKTLLEAMVQNQ